MDIITCSITGGGGRLCNQIVRNIAASIICKRHNKKVKYFMHTETENLGINLYTSINKYNSTIVLKNETYFQVLNNNVLSNIDFKHDFFQEEKITDLIYTYLNTDEQKENIIKMNPFNSRYNNNNDLFIHIRLGDVSHFNPGIEYYIECIKATEGNQIYIASDSPNHTIIKELQLLYPTINIINYDEIKTIQFGSTCKNIILSHGSFSAIIGYLSYFTKNIYYPNENRRNGWCPMGLFTNKGWIGY